MANTLKCDSVFEFFPPLCVQCGFQCPSTQSCNCSVLRYLLGIYNSFVTGIRFTNLGTIIPVINCMINALIISKIS